MESARAYGSAPFRVVVLHGGPGAPGEMAPVARELSAEWGVLEPLQTAATLDGQVEELADVLRRRAQWPVVLIGWSWGAMLGFITAARHPELVRKLVLVSSGPFEEKYAASVLETRLSRLSEDERAEARRFLEELDAPSGPGRSQALSRLGELFARTDAFDPLDVEPEVIEVQEDVYRGVWPQAAALRRSGELLALGAKIACPVVAIHGDYDPHPAEGVREPLSRVVKEFRFVLLSYCGHTPWKERQARRRFFEVLWDELRT